MSAPRPFDRVSPGSTPFRSSLGSMLGTGTSIALGGGLAVWLVLATGAPARAGEEAQFGPLPAAQAPSEAHAAAARSTRPTGEPSAPPGEPVRAPQELVSTFVNCSIVQRGTPTESLWWFGGADAVNYSEVVQLTAFDGRLDLVPPLTWTVLRGHAQVDFANGRDRIVTTGRRAQLFATAPSAASAEPRADVRIRVTDSGGLSCLFETLVYAPDHLVQTGLRDFIGPEGYFTETSFRTEDQFSNSLPDLVEMNQDFGPEESIFPGENWPWPAESGFLVNPFLWCETIERCGNAIFTIPPVQGPQVPLGTVLVDRRSGFLRHGSVQTQAAADNPGIAVKNANWRIFQDHGRND